MQAQAALLCLTRIAFQENMDENFLFNAVLMFNDAIFNGFRSSS